MAKQRVLIVGASALQLPQIIRAKELGFHVGVADMNPNAVGVPFADEFFCVSTIDQKGICEAARSFCADGIVTVATDMPVRSIAYAAEQLNLTGVSMDTAMKVTDKGEMIKAFEAHGVAHPWFYILKKTEDVEGIKDKILYPCISKPTDNSGSRGVVLISSEDELQAALQYSSQCGRTGAVILEEYLTGHEVSVEAFVVDGDAHILAITDKITTGAPHFVELGHTQPSAEAPDSQATISNLAVAAIEAVGIKNGPAHIEIMLTKNGPKMVEMGARMGGDFITTDLVPLSTGIDMLAATILQGCGISPDIERKHSKGSAIRYLQVPKGRIVEINGLDEARKVPGVQRIELFKKVGDRVNLIENSADRVGCVIAQGDDRSGAIEACTRAMELISIITDAE